jgi:hypothetical protein
MKSIVPMVLGFSLSLAICGCIAIPIVGMEHEAKDQQELTRDERQLDTQETNMERQEQQMEQQLEQLKKQEQATTPK